MCGEGWTLGYSSTNEFTAIPKITKYHKRMILQWSKEIQWSPNTTNTTKTFVITNKLCLAEQNETLVLYFNDKNHKENWKAWERAQERTMAIFVSEQKNDRNNIKNFTCCKNIFQASAIRASIFKLDLMSQMQWNFKKLWYATV